MQKERYFYIAILIPIIMIVVVSIGVLIQKKNLLPHQDFLYIASDNYYCSSQMRYKLIPKTAKRPLLTDDQADCSNTSLYVYSFANTTSTKITPEEAMKLPLAPQATSEDGFIINSGCEHGEYFGWPLMENYYNVNFCLKKGNFQRKLNLNRRDRDNGNNYLEFIAWIEGNKA